MQEFQYVQDILKEFYTPVIVNQMYKKAPIWAQLKKKSSKMVGKRIVIPVQLAFSEAVGARADNDYSLPDAQRNTYDQAYIVMKRNYGRIMIDNFSIDSMKGKGGWMDLITLESKGTTNAFTMNLDRQTLMDGKGRMAQVNGAISGQDITVDNPGGITGDTPTTKFFKKGMKLDIYDASGNAHATDIQITAVDPGNNKITVSGTITSVVNEDWIFRRKTYVNSTTMGSGEMMGLAGIIDDANFPGADFEGIDRSTEELWQALVKTSTGVITDAIITNHLDEIEQRTDGELPDLIITTYALRNKLIADAKQAYRTESLELKGGWRGYKFLAGNRELPLMVHRWCPSGVLYYPSLKHIKFYALRNLVWETRGGVLRPVAGSDAVEGFFKIYGNFASDCPNSMGKAEGATTS